VTGLGRLLGVHWRTQWLAITVWVVALGMSMIGTAAGIVSLYDTPEKIHTYAAAVTVGSSLVAINGRVEGIDSLGGIVQDEFGFLAAILMPLLGISLVARTTRREEESGRLESLLAGRVSREVPPVAALVVATAAILATAFTFAVGLALTGIPLSRSILYAASLAALAFVFAAIAVLAGQVTLHARGVYTVGLLALAVAYVLRGVGDVTKTWITWLSPLGWAEKAAPFAAMRWWTLAIPLVVGLALSAAAVAYAARRDLGSSLSRRGGGPARAGAWLQNPVGLAVRIHLPSILGWLAGALILAAMMGALAKQFIDAVLGNPAMGTAIGVTTVSPLDGFVAVIQLYLGIVVMGYAVQSVGILRGEETDGRLEPRLAGRIPRWQWLLAHLAVVLGGLVLIVVAASLTLALTTAWSTGQAARMRVILGSGLAYLPAELVLVGIALALFAVKPRLFPLAWLSYGAIAFIGFLGPALRLARWVLDLSPTTHVGNPPLGTVRMLPLTVMSAIALGLGLLAVVGFSMRRVPQG